MVEYGRRHLRFGWWSLLVFVALGLALEGLHGFKAAGYLDASNGTRRLMWTLAHAHGAMLAMVHVLFGLTVRAMPEMGARRHPVVSRCLVAASLLLPGGFFLGGLVFYGGDPGLGVLLVPVGALAMMLAVFFLARAADALPRHEGAQPVPVRPAKDAARTGSRR